MVVGVPPRVVGAAVVEGAQELAVLEVGLAALGPGFSEVVGVTEGGGDVTAAGGALLVAEVHRLAAGASEESRAAAEVEDLALAAEHGGQDLGVAGQSAGLLGREGLAGGGGRRPSPVTMAS